MNCQSNYWAKITKKGNTMLTVFVCSHCGKELSKSDRQFCDKNNVTECSDCNYFSTIGVKTIIDYNFWLSGKWFIKNINCN